MIAGPKRSCLGLDPAAQVRDADLAREVGERPVAHEREDAPAAAREARLSYPSAAGTKIP